MASTTDICNQALSLLGEQTITSLADATKRAQLCNTFYPKVRDAVLRAHPWNSAVKRVVLAPLSDSPAWGYMYQFQLPGDCLRVLSLDDTDIAFKIEGRKLLCDENTVNMLYIARVEDVNEYDALLIDTLAARLASELAFPITHSKTMVEAMFGLYKDKLREARNIDGQEGTPDSFEINDLAEVR